LPFDSDLAPLGALGGSIMVLIFGALAVQSLGFALVILLILSILVLVFLGVLGDLGGSIPVLVFLCVLCVLRVSAFLGVPAANKRYPR
jgi:hypothetical protein